MLSVNLGRKILDLVPGYVSTEVDIRLSFDSASSETRARRIIALYEVRGAWARVQADALKAQTLRPKDALCCERGSRTGACLGAVASKLFDALDKGGCEWSSLITSLSLHDFCHCRCC